jgi:hypothetical protein
MPPSNSRQSVTEVRRIWHCCQCGGQNNDRLAPACNNYSNETGVFCGHRKDGYCTVEVVQPRKH